MRERFRLPPEYQAGFREQFAGSDNGLLAIAVDVRASVFVPQMQPDVLWFAIEVLRRHVDGCLKPFPALENRPLRPMRDGYWGKPFLNPRDRSIERGHIDSYLGGKKRGTAPATGRASLKS